MDVVVEDRVELLRGVAFGFMVGLGQSMTMSLLR